jgi:hypothetical protein
MRNAILQMPANRTSNEERQVLRAAIRQIDRAEMYVAAVAYMQIDDRAAQREVARVRAALVELRRYLGELRSSSQT